MRRFNRVHDDVELSEVKTPRFNNDEKKYSAKYFSKYSKHGQASTTNVVPAKTAGSLVPLEDNEPWKKWIFDPGSDVMIKWNRVFLITGMIALFIDPMYFYLFSIENDNEISCVKKMDWHLNVALTIFRTISDAFYVLHILFKFRTAFIAPSSRVFGRGELVTDTKQIAKRYLKTQFVIDLAAALPLPQIVSWLMIPGVRHLHPHQNNNTLSLIVLIQYIVRLYRIFPLSQQIINAAGVVTNTAWAGAAYNLLLYMIVSNVIGASYYLLTIDRQTTCWNSACKLENGTSGPPCKMEFLICDFLSAIDQTWANSTRVFANCNASDNSISFNFGIYQNALTSGAVSTSFFRKYFYSLWWGLQSLCTFGQGLSPSTYIWETAFSSLIVLLGLILFAHLISNMETYLQSLTIRLEEWRLRRRDTEQWMSHRQLPQELRDRIRRFAQYKWFATQGVDDDSLLQALPADLRRDIQRHLCLDLVRRVPFFSQMDDPLHDAICEHLVSSLNTEGSYIVREGDPVTEMLFVIRGKLESSTTNGGQTGFFNSIILRPGDFCGEELLSWALLSKPATSLPSSTRTVRALVEVEAFALRAEDLSSVAAQFRRLHSKKLQHTFRFYSHHWRTWAACFIQAAWLRYKRKMRKSISRIESLSFRPESSAAHESSSSHMEQIPSTTSRRSSQGSKGGADMSKLRKPDEPDFSAGNYD